MTQTDLIQKILNASPEEVEIVGRFLDGKEKTLKLYTYKQAAELTGLSRITLWRLVKSGKIRTVTLAGTGKKQIGRIIGSSLEAFVLGVPERAEVTK